MEKTKEFIYKSFTKWCKMDFRPLIHFLARGFLGIGFYFQMFL